ncbi:DUF4004 family protein [Bacillus sonorensis]|nr:DUF4004 family protein [Bacillus sonorensis]
MAHDDLISKKELLDLTSISYGQLYRWKRKNLIPEEWFIRKSTFTGQETFFPKADILNRIKKIQSMKENLSLDEMAEMFSPKLDKLDISRGELLEKGLISEAVMSFFVENTNKRNDSFGLGKCLPCMCWKDCFSQERLILRKEKWCWRSCLRTAQKTAAD